MVLPINLVHLINQRLPRFDRDLYQESDVLPHGKNISGVAWNCRDRSLNTNIQILASHNSPLCDIDWNVRLLIKFSFSIGSTLNYAHCIAHLTNEEQQRLLKYLSPVDAVTVPDSLKSMFDSPQFKDNLIYFRQLLVEGVFDISVSGAKSEDCKTLKRLALFDLTKSKWVENYQRLRDSPSQNPTEFKTMLKCPKRVVMKASYETKEVIDNDGSCFSPRSLSALPTNGGSLMLDSFHFVEENSDQDLLLDVPSNGSFPQAELLQPAVSFGAQQASTCSSSIYPHLVTR
ncbi:hypothetical protein I3760_12G039000 [Carya illinoinensis]|nr:hypothetical protein I3760_12G039000 [Carya illinoinensis]